jgi:hypothetical protein
MVLSLGKFVNKSWSVFQISCRYIEADRRRALRKYKYLDLELLERNECSFFFSLNLKFYRTGPALITVAILYHDLLYSLPLPILMRAKWYVRF